LRMRGDGTCDAAGKVAVAARRQGAGLDLGRQMRFLQREQSAAMEDDVGVGDAAIGQRARCVRKLAAEAAEQGAAGVVLGLPLRGADPAVAIRRAAVLEMKGVQHAVADKPVRAGRIELRIGAVAVEHPAQLAWQLARDFQEWSIAFHRDRRPVGPVGTDRALLLHRTLLMVYLYIVKMK